MSSCILLFGRDETLLSTRQRVLAKIGVPVVSTTDLAELETFAITEPIAVIVLCHTASVEDQQEALARVRRHRPDVFCVAVTSFDVWPSTDHSPGVVLTASRPEALLDAVSRRIQPAGS